MTLVVAKTDGRTGWIVADAALSGGTLGLRDRAFAIKIRPIGDFGLAAFAGDQHFGETIIRDLSSSATPEDLLSRASAALVDMPSVDLAVMVQQGWRTKLYKVTHEGVKSRTNVHLGSESAFRTFQTIRNASELSHPPDAMITFVAGMTVPGKIPRDCCVAIRSMFSLFATHDERDVGGWVLPFMLSPEGPALVGYGYSVTDPIMPEIGAGDVIPHGTAPSGGFAFSLSVYGRSGGYVAYWLQLPGGRVFIDGQNGYTEHCFAGSPLEFKAAARARLGEDIDLWFGEHHPTETDALVAFADQDGRARMVAHVSGRNIQFRWLGNKTDGSFYTSGNIALND